MKINMELFYQYMVRYNIILYYIRHWVYTVKGGVKVE